MERFACRRLFFFLFNGPPRLLWLPMLWVTTWVDQTGNAVLVLAAIMFLAHFAGAAGEVARLSWLTDLVPDAPDNHGIDLGNRSAIGGYVHRQPRGEFGRIPPCIRGFNGIWACGHCHLCVRPSPEISAGRRTPDAGSGHSAYVEQLRNPKGVCGIGTLAVQ